jgi:hypothetical protein
MTEIQESLSARLYETQPYNRAGPRCYCHGAASDDPAENVQGRNKYRSCGSCTVFWLREYRRTPASKHQGITAWTSPAIINRMVSFTV